MRTLELKVNSEIMLYGKKHTIMAIDPPNITLRRTEGDGEFFEIDYYKLISNSMFRSEATVMTSNADSQKVTLLDTLDEQYRSTLTKRFEIIHPIILLQQGVREKDSRAFIAFNEKYSYLLKEGETIDHLKQETLIDRIAKQRMIHKRTIKRYLSNYRKAESVDCRGEHGLIPEYGKGHLQRRDNYTINICHPSKEDWVLDVITTRLPPEIHAIIKEVIEQEYLKLKKISKKETYNKIESKCLTAGIKNPAKSTIYKLLDRIDPKIRDRMREGAKAVREFEPVERGFTNEESMFPLHIVAIDHTRLDVDVIDGKTGCEIGRPFITIGIDLFSRQIWCLYLSFEDPSANVLRKALLQGMFLKRSKEYFGTEREWVVHGIPYNIMVDNGKDFRSVEMERIVNEIMKSNLIFRPRRTPKYSGVVERFFKRLNDDLIHQLDGTRKSNVVQKGEYKSEEEAVMTLEELQSFIVRYIVDIYPYEIHQGLPLESAKPMIRYIEGCKEFGLPRSVMPEDESAYRMELLPTYLKPYTKDGVVLNNVSYKSDELNPFIGPKEDKYKVKYDPDDISKVYFLHPDQQQYVEVFAKQPTADLLEGMNIHVYKALRKKWKLETEEKSKGLPSNEDIVRIRTSITQELEQLYRKNRRARQKAQKMKLQVSVDLEPPKSANTVRKPTSAELLNMAKLARENNK